MSQIFKLQFPISGTNHWAAQYPAEDDEGALQAGINIRKEDYSPSKFEIIIKWKSPRPLPLIRKNSADEIADALRLALIAKEGRSAFGVLMSLRGVGTPVASAILAVMKPEIFTVIDFRALEALGVKGQAANLNFYLDRYLPKCMDLAHEANVDLRTMDRALWAWSELCNKTD